MEGVYLKNWKNRNEEGISFPPPQKKRQDKTELLNYNTVGVVINVNTLRKGRVLWDKLLKVGCN